MSKLKPVPAELKDSTTLGMAATYLFMFSVMPFMQEYVKLHEKIYLNNRMIQDMLDEPANRDAKK